MVVNVTSGNMGCAWTVPLRRVDNNALIGYPSSCGSSAFLDPIELPVGGNYRVAVQAAASGSGSATVRIYDVVDVTTPIAATGVAVPIDLLVPGQNARLPFTGVAGQRVSVYVSMSSGSFGCGTELMIRRMDNNALVGYTAQCGNVGFLDTVTLPADGEYVLVVNAAGTSTGSASVYLYDTSDVATPIQPDGTPVPVDLTTPGRNTRLPFTGTAGQRVSVWVTVTSGNFGCVWPVQIRAANTDALIGGTPGGAFCSQSVGFVEPITLPADGDYVLVVNPPNSWTGTALVRLYTVTDEVQSITPDGPPVSASIVTPGQNTRLEFTGAAGHRVSAFATVTSTPGLGCQWKLRILGPGQTLLGEQGSCNTTAFREPLVLPIDGMYTVVVDPAVHATGTASVALYTVPPDGSGTLTVNDTPVLVALSGPGQNALLMFEGTQGQQVTVRFTNSTIGSTVVRLRRPDNTSQTAGWYSHGCHRIGAGHHRRNWAGGRPL